MCSGVNNTQVLRLSILRYGIPSAACYDIQKLLNPLKLEDIAVCAVEPVTNIMRCGAISAYSLCKRVVLTFRGSTEKEGYLQFTSLIVRTISGTQSVIHVCIEVF